MLSDLVLFINTVSVRRSHHEARLCSFAGLLSIAAAHRGRDGRLAASTPTGRATTATAATTTTTASVRRAAARATVRRAAAAAATAAVCRRATTSAGRRTAAATSIRRIGRLRRLAGRPGHVRLLL